MAQVYRIVSGACWGLGLLSLVVGVAIKLYPSWAMRFDATPRSGVILAGTLFLCTIATRKQAAGPLPKS